MARGRVGDGSGCLVLRVSSSGGGGGSGGGMFTVDIVANCCVGWWLGWLFTVVVG